MIKWWALKIGFGKCDIHILKQKKRFRNERWSRIFRYWEALFNRVHMKKLKMRPAMCKFFKDMGTKLISPFPCSVDHGFPPSPPSLTKVLHPISIIANYFPADISPSLLCQQAIHLPLFFSPFFYFNPKIKKKN